MVPRGQRTEEARRSGWFLYSVCEDTVPWCAEFMVITSEVVFFLGQTLQTAVVRNWPIVVQHNMIQGIPIKYTNFT